MKKDSTLLLLLKFKETNVSAPSENNSRTSIREKTILTASTDLTFALRIKCHFGKDVNYTRGAFIPSTDALSYTLILYISELVTAISP